MCVCIYVCVHIYVHVLCMHVCVCMSIYLRMHLWLYMYGCVCVYMCAFICVCLNVYMCICELKIIPKASFMVKKYSTTNDNHRFKNILYLALYTWDNNILTWSYRDEIAKEVLYNLCFLWSLWSHLLTLPVKHISMQANPIWSVQ